MADDSLDIEEQGDEFPSVPLLQPGWKIKGGGEEANANLQAVALTRRTAKLRIEVSELKSLALRGINVIDTLASQSELEEMDTTDLTRGDGYFVQKSLVLWNGNTWVSSGSLEPDPETLVSEDSNNMLSVGTDGKFYVDLDIDLLSLYQNAKSKPKE